MADPGPCEGAVPAYPLADQTEVEQLGGASLAVPVDRGPMPHAAGEAILDDQGVPVAYRVAPNDVISTIEFTFLVLFVIEMFIKICGLGFARYLR